MLTDQFVLHVNWKEIMTRDDRAWRRKKTGGIGIDMMVASARVVHIPGALEVLEATRVCSASQRSHLEELSSTK